MKIGKIILGVLISVIVICSVLGGVYYYSFYPKTEVKPIDEDIVFDKKVLITKFLPTDFKLNLKEVYVESTADFSEDELTDLFIFAIKELPELNAFVTGLKVDIEDSNINVYFHSNVKNIPMEGKITFMAESKDGKGVFHYVDGKVGFIPIAKDIIFKEAEDTSIVQFDSERGDIMLSFEEIKQLEVRNVVVENNKVELTFRGTIKFWDWLK